MRGAVTNSVIGLVVDDLCDRVTMCADENCADSGELTRGQCYSIGLAKEGRRGAEKYQARWASSRIRVCVIDIARRMIRTVDTGGKNSYRLS